MMKLISSKIVLLFTSLMILLMIGVAVLSLSYIPLKVKESQEKKIFTESNG